MSAPDLTPRLTDEVRALAEARGVSVEDMGAIARFETFLRHVGVPGTPDHPAERTPEQQEWLVAALVDADWREYILGAPYPEAAS